MKTVLQQYRAKNKFIISQTPSLDKSDMPSSKSEREQWVNNKSRELDILQDVFYADARRGLLIVLQGMDTSGKDGTIRHVFHSVDPLGVRVHAFKAPTSEELAHDYLWRVHKAVPKRGEIVIFNRSHYEDVLVTRVRGWIDDKECAKRIRQINDFERMLHENGTHIIKLFLHISKDEQKERLQKRLDNPAKHWKFDPSDLEDRRLWDQFQAQYQTVIRQTNTDIAPWYIVPADSKSARNVTVLKILLEHFSHWDMDYPYVDSSNWPKTVV